MRLFPALPVAFCALLLVAASIPVHAQVSIGPRIGLNLADLAQDPGKGQSETPTKQLLSPQLGLVLNARFGKLAFQPALLFSPKGYRVEGPRTIGSSTFSSGDTLITSESVVTGKGKVRFNYLELPLHVVFSPKGDHGLQLILGPYVALGVGGKGHSDAGTVDVKVTRTIDGRTVSSETIPFARIDASDLEITYASQVGKGNSIFIRRFDAGFNGGIGFWAGPVQAHALYGFGLLNLVPNDSQDRPQDGQLHHRVIQVSITCLLGGR